MSEVQILEADGKPAFAVLPYAEYAALRELAADAADAAALARFAKRHARDVEATVPVEVIDRIMAGQNALRVWREHRGLTAAQLAAAVAITPAHVSKLESGKGEPSVALLRRLSKALQTDIDLLLGASG
jgi:DNA-binding XRE family transcriptional regulator